MSLNGMESTPLIQELDWQAVRVASLIPGRVRLKSAQLRDDAALCARIEDVLGEVDAISNVSISVLTGSVLIHYEQEAVGDFPALIEQAESFGILPDGLDPQELKKRVAARTNGNGSHNFSKEVRRFFEKMDGAVKRATGGALDLKGLAPLTLVGLGLRRVFRGGPLEPLPWFNYFWFAFSLFMVLNAGNESKGSADSGNSVPTASSTSNPQTAPAS